MTEQKYFELLDRIKKESPHHTMITKLSNYSIINTLYIEEIFKELFAVRTITEGRDNELRKVKDANFNKMLRKKYILQSQIRKMSNEFHHCENDEERKQVSIKIVNVETDLSKLLRQIDEYEQKGTITIEEKLKHDDEAIEIPSDFEELKKAKNACFARISQLKKEILTFDESVLYDKKHTQRATYEVANKRLKNFEKKLLLINIELKNSANVES